MLWSKLAETGLFSDFQPEIFKSFKKKFENCVFENFYSKYYSLVLRFRWALTMSSLKICNFVLSQVVSFYNFS